jgi:hypothetical protein
VRQRLGHRHLFLPRGRPGSAGLPSPFTHATVLDTFTSSSSWIPFADVAGSTVTVSTKTVDSHGSLHLSYSLAVGNYAGVSKTGFGSVNMTALGANALRFSYRATSRFDTVEIKLVDSDFPDSGDSTAKVFKFDAVADDHWHTRTVPLSEFDTWTDKGFGGETDSAVFDATALSRLSYGVTLPLGAPLGSGTIRFDNFELYRLGETNLLVNGYETFVANCWVGNTCLNDLGKAAQQFPIEHPEWGSSVIVSTESAPGSETHSRELRFTIPGGGGFYGFAEVLRGEIVLPTDRIDFYVKGAAGGEPLRIQVKSSDSVYPFATINVPTPITASWQKIQIPFSAFLGVPGVTVQPNLNDIREIVFLVESPFAAGRVYIDDVNIAYTSVEGVVQVLEDFSGVKKSLAYGEYAHDDAEMALNFEEDGSIGVSTNVVGRIDYTFYASTETPYAVAERSVGITNLLAEPTIRFRFKGTGANSDLEVKLQDTDGTVYRKVFADVSDTGDVWKTATIPINQWSFFALGADANLTLNRISQIEFRVARGEASLGTLDIDSLESVPPTDMAKTNVGRVLTSVATPDNPFSPNGDGLKDLFRVDYTLSEAATVVFKVFNLQGVAIKTIHAGSMSLGPQTLTWDGVGDNGTRVSNGVYFFVMEADSVYSGKDTFRQVVGVLR